MSDTVSKFVQIAAAEGKLFALDDAGVVWSLTNDGLWTALRGGRMKPNRTRRCPASGKALMVSAEFATVACPRCYATFEKEFGVISVTVPEHNVKEARDNG